VDLNDLYQRHQISLFMADHAACDEARRAHLGMAEGYAVLIDAAKRETRAPAQAVERAPSDAILLGGYGFTNARDALAAAKCGAGQ
jgi:Asp/Glu/hydantoin racemase